jgi:DNA replication protein DnaC
MVWHRANAELTQHGGTAVMESSRWLIEHLLDAEQLDRAMRTINYQMHTARFAVHRDLASFDFASAKADEAMIRQLATLRFTEAAQNVVMIGGTGTGKTHVATALGVAAIQQYGKRVSFYSGSSRDACKNRSLNSE